MKNIQEVKGYILSEIEAGRIGCASMELYDQGYSVRTINSAIRSLLDEKKITISSPVCGFRLSSVEEYPHGLKVALSRRSFDIRKA